MLSPRRVLPALLVLSALLFPQAIVQAVHAQDAPIKIAVEGNFPPFNYLDTNGDLQGFDVEVAKALCHAMTTTCELVVQAWDEMIPGLVEGKYDAVVSSMSMSAERREKVAFTSRYYDSPSTFITAKASTITAFEPADLAGQRLGVTLSTSQEAYAKNLYRDASITVFHSSPELYEGLAQGQVDIILEDKLAAYDWLANTKSGQCCEFRGADIKDPVYFGEGAGIAVRKEDGALLARLEAGLAAITADGTYDMINAKYFPFPIR
jgi:polar amino acid transport system substrate-binding protein